MKKFIALILVATISLLLVACGSDKTLYEVGDTVSTDCAQLTLDSFEIVDNYDSLVNVDGKIFAVLSFSVKNIGKAELGYIKSIDGSGHSLLFSSMPCIDYNNGYLFSYDDMLGTLDFCSTDRNLSDLTPLSDGIRVKVVILVAPEVKTDEDSPLLVKMAVPATKGTEIFTYKIR